MNRLPIRERAWALFLDVDGTLLDIVESPDAVHVPEALSHTLAAAAEREDGALALVSGRSLAQLDRLFAPHRFCAAGLHGLERRTAAGQILRPAIPHARLDAARVRLARFADEHEGLLLEDKGLSLALHFRRAPELESAARDAMQTLLAELGPDLQVQEGKCVLELKPAGATKRTAIEAFMNEPPFEGRLPVFAGDDVTDEDGFAAVNELGGYSIRVGAEAPTQARCRVDSVAALRDWLARIEQLETGR
ncbi:MAG TPA: trehalose-phosphatase [Steroidobacteraceae bacterium]|nr:trehalose-phosphatase [Steroidobacteraceae bacterium]